MAELFGFEINRKKKKEPKGESFVPPTEDDGAITIDTFNSTAFGFQTASLNLGTVLKNERDIIFKYRRLATAPESESAIDDIINEAITTTTLKPSVSIHLDDIDLSDKIKDKIHDEFRHVLRLLDFKNKGYDIFRDWYIDGRLYYHKIIEKNKPKGGLIELRRIDPIFMKKVKELDQETKRKGITQIDVIKDAKEFFLFNPHAGQGTTATDGLKIPAEAITFIHSGLFDPGRQFILSHLHKALKAYNNLKMTEDAQVIYRLSRAPERRIFYIDVGNLPKTKAEQYVKGIMDRYRGRLTYDSTTGELDNDNRHMSIMEDFYLPRREGGRGTEIDTLPGGVNLGEIDDIEYFKRKFLQSLKVPISRLDNQGTFSIGRSDDITRDEIKFMKFISRLQNQFSKLFDDILQTQLVLKGIMTEEEWEDIKQNTFFVYEKDSHFTELREAEVLKERLSLLDDLSDHVGTFFSKDFVRRHILQQNDEEITEMQKQINKEKEEEPDEPEDEDGF